MILSAIFYFIKKVFGYLVKATAWLLINLSLWVPLLFTLVFFIVCGAADTPFNHVSTVFWAGLAASFIISFVISSYLYERRLKNKSSAKAKAKQAKAAAVVSPVSVKNPQVVIKKREARENEVYTAEEEAVYDNEPQAGVQASVPEDTVKYKNNPLLEHIKNKGQPLNAGHQIRKEGLKPKAEDTISSFESYNSSKRTQYREQPEYPEYPAQPDFTGQYTGAENSDYDKEQVNQNPVSDSPVYRAFDKQDTEIIKENPFRLTGERGPTSETPVIFATRADPTVFVYEYADRLDFYKRTRQGMIYMRTQQK